MGATRLPAEGGLERGRQLVCHLLLRRRAGMIIAAEAVARALLVELEVQDVVVAAGCGGLYDAADVARGQRAMHGALGEAVAEHRAERAHDGRKRILRAHRADKARVRRDERLPRVTLAEVVDA